MNALLFFLGALAFPGGFVYSTNRLALRRWRRCKNQHWAEQARILYPVRMASAVACWALPVDAALLAAIFFPDSHLWIFVGIGAMTAATLASLPLNRDLFPWVGSSMAWHWTAFNFISRFLYWGTLAACIGLMPDAFNTRAFAICGAVIVFWFLWTKIGAIWVWRKVGLFKPAPDRLAKLVAETSVAMRIPYRQALVVNAPMANAFAFPSSRTLLFTRRILTVLNDEELAAISAHELAHLAEPWTAQYSRQIRILTLLPLVFIRPMLHVMNPGLALIIVGMTIVVGSKVFRSISRKLESRADGMAKANEKTSGIYAQALTRLHQDNLVPAVLAKATHPNLYDRALAAGLTPDYPRPVKPRATTWYGQVLAISVGVLFGHMVLVNFLPPLQRSFSGKDYEYEYDWHYPLTTGSDQDTAQPSPHSKRIKRLVRKPAHPVDQQ